MLIKLLFDETPEADGAVVEHDYGFSAFGAKVVTHGDLLWVGVPTWISEP